MPIINISFTGQPEPELSEKVAAKVSDLTQSHLRKDPSVTAVVVSYVDPRHWFAGGKSLASQQASSFWLDIKVVDGTNTNRNLAPISKRSSRPSRIFSGLSIPKATARA